MTNFTKLPASYPLATLVEAPPEWMLDQMADDYQAQIVGTHGFGIRHPRAAWLTLVVSSVEECFSCFAPARWRDGDRTAYCARCAEAEIALNAAAVPVAIPEAYETEPTKVEPFLPDADIPPLSVVA